MHSRVIEFSFEPEFDLIAPNDLPEDSKFNYDYYGLSTASRESDLLWINGEINKICKTETELTDRYNKADDSLTFTREDIISAMGYLYTETMERVNKLAAYTLGDWIANPFPYEFYRLENTYSDLYGFWFIDNSDSEMYTCQEFLKALWNYFNMNSKETTVTLYLGNIWDYHI